MTNYVNFNQYYPCARRRPFCGALYTHNSGQQMSRNDSQSTMSGQFFVVGVGDATDVSALGISPEIFGCIFLGNLAVLFCGVSLCLFLIGKLLHSNPKQPIQRNWSLWWMIKQDIAETIPEYMTRKYEILSN